MAGLFKIVCTWGITGFPSNPFVNIFGYRSNLAVINEESALSTSFRAAIPPEIIKVVSDSAKLQRVEVYNVTNGAGYNDYVYPTPLQGLRAGDNMPFFVAWGFIYNRVTAGKRNGAKRFGPVIESDTTGQVPTGAMAALLATLGTKLSAALQVGIIDTWFPEILEKKPTGVYPWTSHPILNVTYKRITSQNSRKV